LAELEVLKYLQKFLYRRDMRLAAASLLLYMYPPAGDVLQVRRLLLFTGGTRVAAVCVLTQARQNSCHI